MGRSRSLRAALLVFTALISSTLASAQPPTIETPSDAGLFRVHPITGAAMPLESIRSKVDWGGRSYYCYLPGTVSSVAFASSEPHLFVARYFGTTLEKLRRSHVMLERLAEREGRRYGTSKFVELEVSAQGEPVFGLDPDRKKNRPAQTFLFRPKDPLGPGEYAFSSEGLVFAEKMFSDNTTQAWAFRIPAQAPVAQRAAPARPSAASNPQPTTAQPEMRQLREAAERGDKSAQSRLGYAYGTGSGVPQDYELAALWFRKAAAQGQMDAQHSLAIMNKDGLGMPKDDNHAAQLFLQAAEQGHATAQVYLAEIYYRGRGLSVDWVEAHKWLNLAAARLTGDDQKQAAGFRDQVAGQLLPAQLADAQRRAREWMEAFEKRRP